MQNISMINGFTMMAMDAFLVDDRKKQDLILLFLLTTRVLVWYASFSKTTSNSVQSSQSECIQIKLGV